MKKLLLIPFLFFSLAACSADDRISDPEIPDQPAGNSNILVAYFSATGNTQRVAERIAKLTGADVYRIVAADPYAANPYDDSDRVRREAYDDLRPGVANLPAAETIARYDTIFVGSPCWWHQPAMVVCTFLEAYDLGGKTIVPFCSHGGGRFGQSLTAITKLVPEAVLGEGLAISYSGGSGMPDDVAAWLEQNQIPVV